MSNEIYISHEVRRGTSLSRKREIGYIKIKIVPFIINFGGTVPLDIHRFKYKNGASVSEELALFNWSYVGYMRSHIWSK